MYNFVFIYFEFGDWSGESDVAAAVGGEDDGVAAAAAGDGLIVSLECVGDAVLWESHRLDGTRDYSITEESNRSYDHG